MIHSIQHSELVALLGKIKHAIPLSFSALTNARAFKGAYVDSRYEFPPNGWQKCPIELGEAAEYRYNPFGEILKLSRVVAFSGFDYERSVNHQQVREGNAQGVFQAAARQWGERIGPALVENKGEYYLVTKVESARKPIYLVRNAAGLLTPIPLAQVMSYLPPKRSAALGQGVNREVVYRNYSLRNIVAIHMMGEQFRVRQPHGANPILSKV